jgi:hypothetical protein
MACFVLSVPRWLTALQVRGKMIKIEVSRPSNRDGKQTAVGGGRRGSEGFDGATGGPYVPPQLPSGMPPSHTLDSFTHTRRTRRAPLALVSRAPEGYTVGLQQQRQLM